MSILQRMAAALFLIWVPVVHAQSPQVLVFSKTEGFRHGSIPAGITAIEQLGQQHGFGVTTTEQTTRFTDSGLGEFDAVIFLMTTGDVLNAQEQSAFERYIQAGGGYVGVHSASDTEYDWPWYGGLVGSYFDRHPPQQTATIRIENPTHPSTENLPTDWERFDEWYDFQSNPRGNVNVLMNVDESTYNGGQMGNDHPIAWYHEYQGGRSWYTGLGHTTASYSEAEFLDHLLGGIRYAAGLVDGPLTVSSDGQWFEYRDSGRPYFMAGVGGPEGFLFETDARKQQIVDQLISSGANALYMHTIRSFQGDGYSFEDPFNTNEDINSGVNATVLDNWRGYLDQLDANGIVSWIHIIDDTARPWGCSVPLPQTAKDYIETIVTRFRDLDHLVWLSGEEYLMGSCSNAEDKALMEAIAAEIRLHDAVHPIGVHHNNGQSMQFGGDANINVFAQQICGSQSVRNPDGVHGEAERGSWVYVMAECHPWHLDLLHENNRTLIRQSNWGTAMAGGYVLLYNAYECQERGRLCSLDSNGDPATPNDPHDPSAETLADLTRIQDFMQLARFNRLSPRDDLAAADTKWVLANPVEGLYAAYSNLSPSSMSVSGLNPTAVYDLIWFNPVTGNAVTDNGRAGSDAPFAVPTGFSAEVALLINDQAIDPPDNLPPTARPDSYQTPPDTPLVVTAAQGVLSNDTDPDGDDITAALTRAATSGVVMLDDDGGFSYQPNLGFTGLDSFGYQASDADASSNEANVNITVVEPAAVIIWLIDAATDQRVTQIADGAVIALSTLDPSQQFNIEAVVSGALSIRFTWSGFVNGSQTENVMPFAAFGDTDGDFNGDTAVADALSITVEAFDAVNAGGTELAEVTLQFQFQDAVPSGNVLFTDGFE